MLKILAVIILLWSLVVSGQINPVQYSGSFSLSQNIYSSDRMGVSQPVSSLKSLLRANITLFGQIELPFEIYLTTKQTEFQQPFNQFGVSPVITDWLKLHAGYFSTRFSDYTFGDLRVLGGGFELTPGDFRIKGLYGRSKSAENMAGDKGFPGVYKQTMYGMQLGYGEEDGMFINMSLLHTIDDTSSISLPDSAKLSANENIAASLSFGIPVLDELKIEGEIAAAGFTNDLKADKFEKVNIPEFIFTPRVSSQFDGAAKLNLNITPSKYWNLKLSTQWIGPGFVTLGYSQMPNDLFEIQAAPVVRIMDNKLNLRSSVGIRYNNLRGNKLSTSKRFTGSFGADYQITDMAGINFQYSNNQIRSAHIRDSIKVKNVFNYLSISPRYSFKSGNSLNHLNASYTLNNTADYNPKYYSQNKATVNTVNISHSIILPSTLAFSTSIMNSSAKVSSMKTNIFNLSENVSHGFFDGLLHLSLTAGINFINTTSHSSQYVFGLSASYSLSEWGSFSLNLTNNSYSGDDDLTPGYKELFGALQYNISF